MLATRRWSLLAWSVFCVSMRPVEAVGELGRPIGDTVVYEVSGMDSIYNDDLTVNPVNSTWLDKIDMMGSAAAVNITFPKSKVINLKSAANQTGYVWLKNPLNITNGYWRLDISLQRTMLSSDICQVPTDGLSVLFFVGNLATAKTWSNESSGKLCSNGTNGAVFSAAWDNANVVLKPPTAKNCTNADKVIYRTNLWISATLIIASFDNFLKLVLSDGVLGFETLLTISNTEWLTSGIKAGNITLGIGGRNGACAEKITIRSITFYNLVAGPSTLSPTTTTTTLPTTTTTTVASTTVKTTTMAATTKLETSTTVKAVTTTNLPTTTIQTKIPSTTAKEYLSTIVNAVSTVYISKSNVSSTAVPPSDVNICPPIPIPSSAIQLPVTEDYGYVCPLNSNPFKTMQLVKLSCDPSGQWISTENNTCDTKPMPQPTFCTNGELSANASYPACQCRKGFIGARCQHEVGQFLLEEVSDFNPFSDVDGWWPFRADTFLTNNQGERIFTDLSYHSASLTLQANYSVKFMSRRVNGLQFDTPTDARVADMFYLAAPDNAARIPYLVALDDNFTIAAFVRNINVGSFSKAGSIILRYVLAFKTEPLITMTMEFGISGNRVPYLRFALAGNKVNVSATNTVPDCPIFQSQADVWNPIYIRYNAKSKQFFTFSGSLTCGWMNLNTGYGIAYANQLPLAQGLGITKASLYIADGNAFAYSLNCPMIIASQEITAQHLRKLCYLPEDADQTIPLRKGYAATHLVAQSLSFFTDLKTWSIYGQTNLNMRDNTNPLMNILEPTENSTVGLIWSTQAFGEIDWRMEFLFKFYGSEEKEDKFGFFIVDQPSKVKVIANRNNLTDPKTANDLMISIKGFIIVVFPSSKKVCIRFSDESSKSLQLCQYECQYEQKFGQIIVEAHHEMVSVWLLDGDRIVATCFDGDKFDHLSDFMTNPKAFVSTGIVGFKSNTSKLGVSIYSVRAFSLVEDFSDMQNQPMTATSIGGINGTTTQRTVASVAPVDRTPQPPGSTDSKPAQLNKYEIKDAKMKVSRVYLPNYSTLKRTKRETTSCSCVSASDWPADMNTTNSPMYKAVSDIFVTQIVALYRTAGYTAIAADINIAAIRPVIGTISVFYDAIIQSGKPVTIDSLKETVNHALDEMKKSNFFGDTFGPDGIDSNEIQKVSGTSSGNSLSDETKYIIVGAVVGGVSLIAIVAGICCYSKHKKKKRAAKNDENDDEFIPPYMYYY